MISDNETPKQRAAREQLQRITALLASGVKKQLEGAEACFALILFDVGEKGAMAYASDGDRKDVIRALRELLGKIEMDETAAAVVLPGTGKSS